MRFATAAIIAALLVPASGALAVDYKPYPHEKVTENQWADYLGQVKTSFGGSIQELHDEHLVLFHDDATATNYAFTTPGHPAHPAWITRRLVQEGNQVFLDQVGYFAGREAPFALLFQQYQATNRRMMEALRQKRNSK